MKTLVFDMDGTIVDFYGVNGWLEDLQTEQTRPYDIAEPLWDMDELNTVLEELQKIGWHIVVTSWLAKQSTEQYKTLVRRAKLEWLARNGFPYDEIHLVQYGTTKANCTRKLGGNQILVDDNKTVREGWHLGETIDPTTENLIEILKKLLDN